MRLRITELLRPERLDQPDGEERPAGDMATVATGHRRFESIVEDGEHLRDPHPEESDDNPEVYIICNKPRRTFDVMTNLPGFYV